MSQESLTEILAGRSARYTVDPFRLFTTACLEPDVDMADDPYIAALQRVIAELHGCAAQHLGTVNVEETIAGKILWQGDVEVFVVVGHPRAARCYAWVKKQGRRRTRLRFYAVLGNTFVKTPLDAVKFAHLVSTSPLVEEFSKLI